MMSGNYTAIDSQKATGSVPAVSDSPGHVAVKFTDSNLQQFPPSVPPGKIAGGSGPPRDVDDTFSNRVSGPDEPQPSGWFQAFSIAYYRPFFDVDTSDVLERIKDSLIFFRGSFSEKTAKFVSWKLSDVLFEAISTGQVVSLYQGLGTKNLQSFISQFVYFYGYSYFKRLYLEKSGSKSIGTKANLLLAAAAGACTAIVTQPLDTAASRMQTSAFGKSKGLWKTLAEGGSWSDAFDGLGISLMLTSNPAIQYTVFDQLKIRLLKGKQNKTEKGSSPEALSAFSAFVLGAISKSIATVLTYPVIRCKVMIQAADPNDDKAGKTKRRTQKKTVAGTISAIWKREGVFGFFKGLDAQILKTVLSSALLLMIKEKIVAISWVLILATQRYLLLSRPRLKNA